MELGGWRLLTSLSFSFLNCKKTQLQKEEVVLSSLHSALTFYFRPDQYYLCLFRCECSLRVWCVKSLVKIQGGTTVKWGHLRRHRPSGRLCSHSIFPLCFLVSEVICLLCHALPPWYCLNRDPKQWAHSILPGTSRAMKKREGLFL